MPCDEALNQVVIDQSKFWDSDGLHWDAHRIGWAIAGGCAALTVIISGISVMQHYRNYTNPRQQRQILRILYMPPVYAVVSFLSYRFFRYYTYYSLVYIAYEAITLSAFLLLIIEYVAATATGKTADKAIERKDKRPLPLPFCFWRYRPTKAYFMYTVKWSVLQYVIVRPAASVAGIICEHFNLLCASEGFTWRYADVYIEAINFVSISIALYGLLVFYGLMAEELKGKRPVAKFLSIKLIVMFTFYQTFMFHALEGRVIHATTYWTSTNIANGLNALAICIEMVIFSILMWWAYTAKEYTRKEGTPATGILKPMWDSINYMDFLREIATSIRFFFSGKPATLTHDLHKSGIPTSSTTTGYHRAPGSTSGRRMSFGEAFGLQNQNAAYYRPSNNNNGGSNNNNNNNSHNGNNGDGYDAYPLKETTTMPSSAGGGGGSLTLGGRVKQKVGVGLVEDYDDKEEREALTRVSGEGSRGIDEKGGSAYHNQGQSLSQYRPPPQTYQSQSQGQQQLPPSQQQQQQQYNSNYGSSAPPIPRSLRPAPQNQRPESDMDLGYYQNAYGSGTEGGGGGGAGYAPPLRVPAPAPANPPPSSFVSIPQRGAPAGGQGGGVARDSWTGARAL